MYMCVVCGRHAGGTEHREPTSARAGVAAQETPPHQSGERYGLITVHLDDEDLRPNDGRPFTLSSFEIRILSLNFFPFIQNRSICDSGRSGGVPRGGVAASRDASGATTAWGGRPARHALG